MDPEAVNKIYDLLIKIHKSLLTENIECDEDEKKEIVKNLTKSFRKRARDIPSQVYSNGLAYTMLYLYSKAGDNLYKKVKEELDKLVKNGSFDKDKIFYKNGKSDKKCEENEALSYSLYLYIIYWILKNIINYRIPSENMEDIIGHLFSNSGRESFLYGSQIIPYLVIVKRFAEAMYESEDSG